MNLYHELMVDGAAGIVLKQKEDKTPADNYVKIAAQVSLVSPGTEKHYVEECRKSGESLSLGYCSSGIVEDVGANVRRIKKGDRVIAMGWKTAVHAEKIFVPQNLCCRIPPEVTFDDAVFANLGATAIHAIHRAEILAHDVVLIVGGGLVGQLIAQYVRQKCPYAFLTDLEKSRMDIAEKGGIKTIPSSELYSAFKERKITKVFICISGNADGVFESVLSLLNPKGNGVHRSKIIGVGRFKATIDFSVALGNIDIVYSARCGEGYRDIDYETGNKMVNTIGLEQNVQENLNYCIESIYKREIHLNHLKSKRVPFKKVLEYYPSSIKDNSLVGILMEY